MRDIFNFLLGALVGAIFALLFAPQTGEELRANLLSTAEEDWGKLQEKYPAEMEKIQHSLEQLKSKSKQEGAEAVPTGQDQDDAAENEADQPA